MGLIGLANELQKCTVHRVLLAFQEVITAACAGTHHNTTGILGLEKQSQPEFVTVRALLQNESLKKADFTSKRCENVCQMCCPGDGKGNGGPSPTKVPHLFPIG